MLENGEQSTWRRRRKAAPIQLDDKANQTEIPGAEKYQQHAMTLSDCQLTANNNCTKSKLFGI